MHRFLFAALVLLASVLPGMDYGLGGGNASGGGGGGGSGFVRPLNAFISTPGTVHYYFPLDRMYDHDSRTSFVSIAGTGSSMWAAGAATPTVVAGHYDWAQTGTILTLDTLGFGGQNGYPGTAWTWSYSVRFRQQAVGQSFDIVWKSVGGGNPNFIIRDTAGALGASGYTTYNGGQYMFPANDSPGFGLQPCGAVANDLLDHIVQVTMTNDPTGGGGGGLLKVWSDGVLQGSYVGRAGFYIASTTYRNVLGGFNGVGPAVPVSFSDVGEWNVDASSIFGGL